VKPAPRKNRRTAVHATRRRQPGSWTKPAITAEIVRLHKLGVRITERGLLAGHEDLLSAIKKHAGGVVAARRAANVPAPPPMRAKKQERWAADRVITEIKRRHRSNKSLAYSRIPHTLVRAGMRYFGSWKNAVNAAGISYDKVRLLHAEYTADDLVAVLLQLSRREPDMTRRDLSKQGFYWSLIRVFGTMDAGLKRAGISGWPVPTNSPALSKAQALSALRKRYRAGASMAPSAVIQDDSRLYRFGMIHYGDWSRFCDAAGVNRAPGHKRWTRDTVLDALRERERKGLSLTPAAVNREDKSLYAAVCKYFGSSLRGAERVASTPSALRRKTHANPSRPGRRSR